jgi:P-type Ca2+ transporter type 2C
LTSSGEQPLTPERVEQIRHQAREMAQAALRVLGVAFRRTGTLEHSGDAEKELVFTGLIGIQDPPRPEVFPAIRICTQAGIRPVMITGDHLITGVAVARELGILRPGAGALTGEDLDKMEDEELAEKVRIVDVFARISPEHKLRIVNAFLADGQVVAMTGDGVNDAPSLKRADIGVAMGITGTDVSKEASDMILTDDNFATIVEAIREGRSIFQNIRKYLVFLLSGNLGTVLALVIALLTGLPLPLAAVQVLFINFIMDGLIAIALGVEPPEHGIMRHRPRKREEGMLNREAVTMIGVVGIAIGLVPLGVYVLGLRSGMEEQYAMTLFFWALIASRLVNGFNCRSLVDSAVFGRAGHQSNPVLYGSMGVTLILTAMTLYIPGLHRVFDTASLHPTHVMGVVGASLLVLLVSEVLKFVRKRSARTVVTVPAGQ